MSMRVAPLGPNLCFDIEVRLKFPAESSTNQKNRRLAGPPGQGGSKEQCLLVNERNSAQAPGHPPPSCKFILLLMYVFFF